MSLLGDILRKVEDAMSSAAFAEAGEFDMARDFMRDSKNANKKVLLGTDDADIDQKVIRYALNLCKRMGASLEILHVLRPEKEKKQETASNMDVSLDPLQDSLQKLGVVYHPEMCEDCFKEKVIEYTEKRRDILCFVMGSLKSAAKEENKEKINNAWLQKLKCPVVIYGEPSESGI